MAVVWAKSNGNWTDTTLWAFWNETTQQIEDYGQVPQVDDVVYCNGFQITLNTDVNISSGEIRNDINPYTNAINGRLYTTASRTIIANLYAHSEIIYINLNLPVTLNINGNINGELDAHHIIGRSTNDNLYLFINGNIFCEGLYFINNASNTTYICTLTINGNCKFKQNYTNRNEKTANSTITVNGQLVIYKDFTIYGLTINGKVFFYKSIVESTYVTINGSIEYSTSTNQNFGIISNNMIILNPDTFTWKDITEPRTNPFIIVTDAEMNNRQQYPAENEVKEGTEYVWGEKVGTYQQPPESVVLKGYRYDNDEKEGTLENENIVGCVTPEDVRKDVPLVGMGVVGSLVVPSADDVREGVIFDNGSVGTLIVQGGGDRLRIADFGYYTNAQSDTYIVDLTEQDKPKFAVAEERVLIEMFPDLDLDNIPDKYFDDLFVKFLKYRLIVEYYRTAGINSTFTPSEPTTEIVNYQNVRNEVWLNSANIYLKAWSKKYPESIVKPQRILL